jgi:hypothetical protein
MNRTPAPLLHAILEADWFGQPVAGVPALALSLEGGCLCLSGSRRIPAHGLPTDRPGEFIEGLWEGDCAEAFLLNPENGHYLELNLSPSGSWWACHFSAPRVRATPQGLRLAGATGEGLVEPEGWSARLRVPLASLPSELAFAPETSRANLTMCLGRNPQRYLTLCDLGGGQPDFHRPLHWGTLRATHPGET